MTAALLWKEYRQQRAIWVIIAALAIGGVACVGGFLGKGTGLERFQDRHVVDILYGIVIALAVAQGVVTGAALLASDKEDGTLGFLDGLTGMRRPLFAGKVSAGLILALSQSLLLACLAMGLGFGTFGSSRNVFVWLPVFAIDGLIWGLLAGALCRTVLIGILAGFALNFANWPLAALIGSMVEVVFWAFGSWTRDWGIDGKYLFVASKTVVGLLGIYASWRIYCRDDLSRAKVVASPLSRLTTIVPAEWRVMLWLVIRQGRLVLCGCLVGALALAVTGQFSAFGVWQIGAMALGLACGLAAFTPDYKYQLGNPFLASQRLPAGRVWTFKIVFWAAVCAVSIALAQKSLYLWIQWPNRTLFWMVWPLYGFSIGQFFGQVAGRPISALILAVFIAPMVTTLWAPSLYFGGVALWQILIIPVLLLLCTRLAAWPAVGGRIFTTRPIIGIACAAGLSILTTAGFFWFRANEIADVGMPFEMKAFSDGMPSAAENKSGDMILKAAKAITLWQQEELGGNKSAVQDRFHRQLDEVLRMGWPQKSDEIPRNQEEFNRHLDQLFAGEWVASAREAAHMPLGMIDDPRHADMVVINGGYYLRSHLFENYYVGPMTQFFVARALQLQSRGDSRGALDHLETALGLSRQVKSYANSWQFRMGCGMEDDALRGFRRWLENVGPDKELLKEGLRILQRHEAAAPDPANTVKVDYLIRRNALPSFEHSPAGTLESAAYDLPWESERRVRIDRAVTLARLRQFQMNPVHLFPVYEEIGNRRNLWLERNLIAMNIGLPLTETSDLSVKQWSEAIVCTSGFYYALYPWLDDEASRRTLHAVQLVTALSLYQAEHGKLPAKLDELCPVYLPVLPIDPVRGEPFEYGIAADAVFSEIKDLIPEQRVVWTKTTPTTSDLTSWRDWVDEWGQVVFPVPVWKK